MKNRYLAFAAALLLVIPLVLSAKNVKIKKIGNKKSAVTFEHNKHMARGKAKKGCKTCHHKGSVRDDCGKCHQGTKGMRAVHKTCINECHRPQRKGPRSCRKCHK
ncbi:MAG: cytochrome c3 family protein [bacterium]|nr:cytochrome c3 family protein [bacterium]